jgi:hypothetical protein
MCRGVQRCTKADYRERCTKADYRERCTKSDYRERCTKADYRERCTKADYRERCTKADYRERCTEVYRGGLWTRSGGGRGAGAGAGGAGGGVGGHVVAWCPSPRYRGAWCLATEALSAALQRRLVPRYRGCVREGGPREPLS